jgi:uncharacterized glyoxalase superfamily protein PhnB
MRTWTPRSIGLVGVFGFTERLRLRLRGPDGKANHAELTLTDGLVMMGHPTYGAEDPEGHQWSFAQQVREVEPGAAPA